MSEIAAANEGTPIILEPDVRHHIKLFHEAFSGSGADTHRLMNTIGWLGDLGTRAQGAVPLLAPIMDSANPPFRDWSIKASAARALIRIQPDQFLARAENVLYELVTSPEFPQHIAGSLVLGWHGKVSKTTFDRLQAHAISDASTQDFRDWFAKDGSKLKQQGDC